jgi:hypothetical protein
MTTPVSANPVWTENRIFAEDTLLARFFMTGR